jgi:hypothetical protein
VSVRPRRRSVAGACITALVVAGLAAVVIPSVSGAGLLPSATLRVASGPSGMCPGSELAHTFLGSVAIVNSTLVPEVNLTYSFSAQIIGGRELGLPNSTRCVVESGSIESGPTGAFNLSILPLPDRVCAPWPGVGEYCNSTSGPYVSVSVSADRPYPAGYLPTVLESDGRFFVRFYPELASLVLDPAVPVATYSTDALDPVAAVALSALGTPTPVVPQFTWTLSGTGWSFSGPVTGPVVNLTAAPGAAIGELSVVAGLPSVTGELVTPAIGLALVAEPTVITAADLNRTSVDVGASLSLTVDGSGAAGYSYVASVAPGLGLSSAPVPCAVTGTSDGGVTLSCATVLSYPEPGTAQPVVTLSNGNSTATWALPTVAVATPAAVMLAPVAPEGYAGVPIPVEVTAGAGSGIPPYAEACLATEIAEPVCSNAPGPVWQFAPVFPLAGTYPIRAWTVDATGSNRSAEATVSVADPLAISALSAASNGSAGTPLPLAATISGGLLPLRVWWNATGLSAPFAIATDLGDGPTIASFLPTLPGFVTVSCVVRDALGTVEATSWTLSIGPGLASAVVPDVLPSTDAVVAGAPLPVSWEALDAAGVPARTFASAAEIALEPSGGGAAAPGWVNASGVGALPSPVPGWFSVPAGAWLDGVLNVSVTPERSGAFSVVLEVAADLASGPAPIPIVVRADADHLRLSDPVTRVASARTNDTLWQVTDAFGNPVAGATLVVTTTLSGGTSVEDVPVQAEPGGRSGAWLNLTAPGAGEGEITVRDVAGDLVLPPIAIAAAPGTFAILAPLLGGLAVGGTVMAAARLASRRRRPAAIGPPASDEEDALHRLAEGRATLVELVRRAGAADVADLAAAWSPPPAPAELADWIASLVTDGTFGARIGDDGIARFCLASPGLDAPRVTVDLDAFDLGERRRSELSDGDGADD